MLADVAVFDTDLVKAGKTRPADLLGAKVLYTIVAGKLVYEAAGPAGGR
jgi:predicted amidohydrolase YtcJ